MKCYIASKVYAMSIVLVFIIILSSTSFLVSAWIPGSSPGIDYIVQSYSAAAARSAVEQAGGAVTEQLNIIDGVAATLHPDAITRLRSDPRLIIHPDTPVFNAREDGPPSTDLETAGKVRETDTNGYLLYPSAATNAHLLHEQQVPTRSTMCSNQRVTVRNSTELRPLRGWGVTVALVDSGFMKLKDRHDWTYSDRKTGTLIAEKAGRCIIYREFAGNSNEKNSDDPNGHGTHVLSTVGDRRVTSLAEGMSASPVGIAPDVNLMVARALGKDGSGSYAQVIAAIQWIVQNRDIYNVRVLNLSLYSPVTGPYWSDPLNQAVMRAWEAGIVVVTTAGNDGPEAGTIGAPGNIPYVITVGAITSGRYTTSGFDELASYSSRGPTESAFVKPDIVVPATRTIAPMPKNGELSKAVRAGRVFVDADPDYGLGSASIRSNYYQLSGTSMAAAEVSGIAALMLQANPELTNDQVKYRLMSTARPAVNAQTGELVYTPWEQGAGLVDTQQAVMTTTLEAANRGMSVTLDLETNSNEHYWGHTLWDKSSDTFRLRDPRTGKWLVWNGGRRSWSRSTDTWTGEDSSSSRGTDTWAGQRRLWKRGSDTWAGNERSWIRSTPDLANVLPPQAELVLNDGEESHPDEVFYLLLPLVQR